MNLPLLSLAVLTLAALPSCSAGSPACRAGADCLSGVCQSDGTCAPRGPADAGRDAAQEPDAGGDEQPPEQDTFVPPESGDGPVVCQPNHDGVVTREEVPLAAGVHATFRVALNAAVDTSGTPQAGGTRKWDLTANLPGDHLSLIEMQSLQGKWFAPNFPGASYAAQLSDKQDLLGVFEIKQDSLLLRGVVSPTGGLQRTELTYDPAVVTLAFPIKPGATWQTLSKVTGMLSGVLISYPYTEKYESQVDATGDLVAPYSTFPVHRVRVVLTRTVGVVPTTIRTFLFVTECFGTVASVTSQDNEPKIEFTNASEVKRLSP
jgi:hypothetical protein